MDMLITRVHRDSKANCRPHVGIFRYSQLNKDGEGKMKKTGQFVLALAIVLFTAHAASAQASIVAPAAGSAVSGTVSFKLQLASNVYWTQLLVDSASVGSGYNLLGWDSTGVANGTHLVTIKAYAKGSSGALGQAQLNLIVQNSASEAASSTTLVNPQNPRNYGATGNGTTDDTSAFQSAISHGDLHVTTGTYLINSGVRVPNYRNIECDSGVTLYTTRHSSTDSGILQWVSTGYGSVIGCNFKGSNTRPSLDGNQGSYLIMLAGATHVSIVNDTFKNAWGDAAVHISHWSQPSSYNSVQGCSFQSNALYAVAIIVGTYNTISYNNVIDSSMGDEVNHTYDANTGNVFSYNTVQGVNGNGYGQVFLCGGVYPSGANYGGDKVFSNVVTGRSYLLEKGPVTPAQYSSNTCSSGCRVE